MPKTLLGDSDSKSSDEEMVNAGDGGAKKKVAPQKQKHGVKSGRSPFASLEDYEHLMARNAETTLKGKRKATGRAGGDKKLKSRSQNKRSRGSK
jgi:ribosome biogenesis protein MAK21